MSIIVPAVIPTSRQHLDTTLSLLGTFTDSVQVDVVDGVFAPQTSWPYAKGVPLTHALESVFFDTLSVELDLMIQNPEETLDLWLGTKPTRIIVHVESTEKLSEVVEHASIRGYQLGLAFNNETSLSLLQEIDIAAVDFIQLMGIAEIGAQGNPFDERVLERIGNVKEMFPDMPVSIDGGVSEETITKLRKAGADRFVSGSAILKPKDPAAAYTKLSQLAGARV